MNVLKTLTEQGAIVEFFSVETMEYMIPAYYIIASAEASSNLERFDGVKYGYRAAEYEGLHDMYKKTRTEAFGEEVKRRIMLGSFVLSSGYYDAYYLKALRTKALIKKEFDQAFEKYEVILAPAAPYTAPKIGESLKDPLAMYLGDIYTVLLLPSVHLQALLLYCLRLLPHLHGIHSDHQRYVKAVQPLWYPVHPAFPHNPASSACLLLLFPWPHR